MNYKLKEYTAHIEVDGYTYVQPVHAINRNIAIEIAKDAAKEKRGELLSVAPWEVLRHEP